MEKDNVKIIRLAIYVYYTPVSIPREVYTQFRISSTPTMGHSSPSHPESKPTGVVLLLENRGKEKVRGRQTNDFLYEHVLQCDMFF